jgi:hypothetical protein
LWKFHGNFIRKASPAKGIRGEGKYDGIGFVGAEGETGVRKGRIVEFTGIWRVGFPMKARKTLDFSVKGQEGSIAVE